MLARNDLVFQNIVVSSTETVIFWMVSFMQQWKQLNKEDDQR